MTSKKTKMMEVAGRLQADQNQIANKGTSTFTSDSGKVKYDHLLAPVSASSDLIDLLSNLPALTEDSVRHSEAVLQLAKLVALQQRQIAQLQLQLQAVVSGAIGVRVQENMHDLIRGLSEAGSDVEEPEVRVTMSGTLKHSTSRTSAAKSDDNASSTVQTKMHGEMQGLLKLLAGLNFSADSDRAEATHAVKSLEDVETANIEEARSAEVVLKFKSIKGSPLAHAEAELMRSSPEKLKLLKERQQTKARRAAPRSQGAGNRTKGSGSE